MFRNHVFDKLKMNLYFSSDNYNEKTVVGSYFRKNEINADELKMFGELKLTDYEAECIDMGTLAEILYKESISSDEANAAVSKFSEYGFNIKIINESLAVEKFAGKCLPLGFGYDSEYFKIKIK
jgi:hypothetical protein